MKSSYIKGALWALGACLMSVLNDTLVKISGIHLPGAVVLFFRFFFSACVLLPFVIKDYQKFRTRYFWVHGIRGFLFSLAMLPWCYGLIKLPLPLITIFSLTTPLFVTALAGIFLKETIGWGRIGATTVGFLGILISAGNIKEGYNAYVFLVLGATFLFAVLDIVNKRLLVLQEEMGPMIFFSALWTAVCSAPFAWGSWVSPQAQDWVFLILLGVGANALLWCLLKASQACDLSSLQPVRYTELIFSAAISVLVFGVWPNQAWYFGAALIIPATIYLARHEMRLERRKKIIPEETWV